MSKRKFVVKSGMIDLINFAKMIPERKAHLENGPLRRVPATYPINELAKLNHPGKMELCVSDIIVHSEDVKSYILKAENSNKKLAPFRAGQYLTVQLKIGNSLVTRPYSIASTPNDARKGFYNITVKRVPDGFVSGYILDNIKIGDKITAFSPEGTFVYEPIRDAKTVVGIAGGSGITPFLSLAGSIADGTCDADLVLLYGARTSKDLVFKAELDELGKNDKITVVYVLSDSKEKGYEKGFITAELIQKYAPETYSIFLCGPKAMYEFAGKEIEKLNIRKKFVRFELFTSASKASQIPGFPMDKDGLTFELTVRQFGKEKKITCLSNESILVALERAGIEAPARCRSGECGFCRSKLVSGDVFVPSNTDGRRIADIKFGYIHPCSTYPMSDIVIKID
ncbi:MAG: 2Fe-2S iron-sulfur cluster binding domain-containing protein [Clostridiales bacterium]|nr:2Fe-2S iron-sulfur cluster binding domain-containing protein [Clostridiales bacterium]